MGFITGHTEGEIQNVTEDEVVNVFLPTTPNPTSGWLILVDPGELRVVEMSIEEAVKLIVSGGIVGPDDFAERLRPWSDEDRRALPQESGT